MFYSMTMANLRHTHKKERKAHMTATMRNHRRTHAQIHTHTHTHKEGARYEHGLISYSFHAQNNFRCHYEATEAGAAPVTFLSSVLLFHFYTLPFSRLIFYFFCSFCSAFLALSTEFAVFVVVSPKQPFFCVVGAYYCYYCYCYCYCYCHYCYYTACHCLGCPPHPLLPFPVNLSVFPDVNSVCIYRIIELGRRMNVATGNRPINIECSI